MERKANSDIQKDQKPWWINIGGGSHRNLIKGRIIKPKERFQAYPDQIPPAFRDVIIPADQNSLNIIQKESEKEEHGNKPVYKKVEREAAKGYYDVVDENGKVFNTKALRETAADSLVNSLNS